MKTILAIAFALTLAACAGTYTPATKVPGGLAESQGGVADAGAQ